jgi:hypothetical protein
MTPLGHALSFLGLREDPKIPNGGEPARLFNGGEAKAWCASMMAECFRLAGIPLPGKPWMLPSVEYMEQQLKANGAWWSIAEMEAGRLPEPGDLVFFDRRLDSDAQRGGRHTGMVINYDLRKRRIETIEGNVSNMCKRMFRSHYGITGFARWKGSK